MTPLLRYQDVLWAVKARVGGEEALFLLDTAAGVTTLDRALADRLGVRTEEAFTARRMTGETVTLDLTRDLEIELGGRSIQHPTVGVFDLAALLPPGWPALGGAIGLPTFEGSLVSIDFVLRTLQFDASRDPSAHELSVRPAREGPSLDLFVEVCTPAGSLWLEVDTANTGPVMLSPDAAAALGLAGATEQDTQEATLDVRGMGPVATPVVVRPIRYDGNLGGPFFAEHVLTLDLVAMRAWVDRR